jgi:hypothetical protein
VVQSDERLLRQVGGQLRLARQAVEIAKEPAEVGLEQRRDPPVKIPFRGSRGDTLPRVPRGIADA